MFRAFIFYGSLATIGAVFAVVGGINLSGGVVGPGSVLLSLGGIGIVLYSMYTLVVGAPTESVPDDRWVIATAVGAALLVLWVGTISPLSVGSL